MNPNDPAFPIPIDDMGTLRSLNQGISIRAHIATAAMQGLLACPESDGTESTIALFSVRYADALIAELNKTP